MAGKTKKKAPKRFGNSETSNSRSVSDYVVLLLLIITGSVVYRTFIVGEVSCATTQSTLLKGSSVPFPRGTLRRERVATRSSFFNNPNVVLDPHVYRPWLESNPIYFPNNNGNVPKPKVKLVLTEFGWNYHDQSVQEGNVQTQRSKELMQGFIDHPYFDPTFKWNDMVEGKIEIDPDIVYIVMLDLETTFELIYPSWGGSGLQQQFEKQPCRRIEGCLPYIQSVLDSPLFKQVKTSHLLYIGYGFPEEIRKQQLTSSQVSLASVSAEPQELNTEADMGFPPPACNPSFLSPKERNEILTCESELPENRRFFFSFLGDERPGFGHREDLFKLNNNNDILVMNANQFKDFEGGKYSYGDVIKHTIFGAVPRGHALFSYRFTEVLSAGTIPVILADNWVLPFRKEIVDWSECAVIVPEKDSLLVVDILKKFSAEERCKMRQKCLQIYETYIANPENEIEGIVDSIVAIEAARGNM